MDLVLYVAELVVFEIGGGNGEDKRDLISLDVRRINSKPSEPGASKNVALVCSRLTPDCVRGHYFHPCTKSKALSVFTQDISARVWRHVDAPHRRGPNQQCHRLANLDTQCSTCSIAFLFARLHKDNTRQMHSLFSITIVVAQRQTKVNCQGNSARSTPGNPHAVISSAFPSY